MSILIDRNTRVLVQGITGRDGSFHAEAMLRYGTQVVGGVTPGKGGQRVHDLPVFDSMAQATAETGATCAIVFVPARFASAAIREAVDSGITLIACITEGIPVLETIANVHYAREHGAQLIGPNCPGLITPGACKVGIMPALIHRAGGVGVMSRSGTLTYEVVDNLSRRGIGQSTCIGIGGDPVVGTGFVDVLRLFEADQGTRAVVLIGEIGGADEESAAAFIHDHMTKPVAAFIAGRTAPPDKRMGHAGAIIADGKGTAESKVRALREAGVIVVDRPDQIPDAVSSL